MYNVLVTEPLPGDAVDRLSKKYEVTVAERGALKTEKDLLNVVKDYDALLTLLSNPVTSNVLEAAPRLKVVANYAVGYNNIDTDAAKKLGVRVANTPDVLTDATADLTLALILSVTRRLGEAEKHLRDGKFDDWMPEGFLGFELNGAKLGIVGMGRIGRAVAKRALAFGMNIGYSNRNRLPKGVEDVQRATYYSSVPKLAEWCDILTLHCPLNENSHHLVDSEILQAIGSHGYVINTARGPVVNEAALADALHSKIIAGAGIDVFEREPEVHPDLMTAPNAVLLPHIGSATHETRQNMAELSVNAIDLVLQGRSEEVKNLVI